MAQPNLHYKTISQQSVCTFFNKWRFPNWEASQNWKWNNFQKISSLQICNKPQSPEELMGEGQTVLRFMIHGSSHFILSNSLCCEWLWYMKMNVDSNRGHFATDDWSNHITCLCNIFHRTLKTSLGNKVRILQHDIMKVEVVMDKASTEDSKLTNHFAYLFITILHNWHLWKVNLDTIKMQCVPDGNLWMVLPSWSVPSHLLLFEKFLVHASENKYGCTLIRMQNEMSGMVCTDVHNVIMSVILRQEMNVWISWRYSLSILEIIRQKDSKAS